jgi:hypothetical protein
MQKAVKKQSDSFEESDCFMLNHNPRVIASSIISVDFTRSP